MRGLSQRMRLGGEFTLVPGQDIPLHLVDHPQPDP